MGVRHDDLEFAGALPREVVEQAGEEPLLVEDRDDNGNLRADGAAGMRRRWFLNQTLLDTP
jgi:hypothetical protein